MPIEIDSNGDDVPRDSESAEPNGHKLEVASNSVSAVGSEKQVSDVFQHIVPSADKKHFICKLCQDKNVMQKWTNKSTTNFQRHLEQKHADVYTSTISKTVQTKLLQFSLFERHAGNQAASRPQKRKHADDGFTKADKEFADKKMVDWIVNHAQSFSVVEQADFRQFCEALRSEYEVPTRNTICSRVLKRWQDAKNKVRSKLREDLEKRRFGLTTDMWTSAAKRGYMVVTIHYIDSNWNMRHCIIAFIRVLYPHMGEQLAVQLIQAVKEMDPSLLLGLWSIIGDNASSNMSMVDHINLMLPEAIADFLSSSIANDANSYTNPDIDLNEDVQLCPSVFLLPCMAHTLQLAVKEGLKRCSHMDVAIGTFRDLLKKINDSLKLMEAPKSVASTLKLEKLALPQLDVENRWNCKTR
ncbi:hypothetical protein Mp_1g16640 [Marchantia polymorpha subsp. ruderalis]|uniref:BED-type domain-containing protein n=2 Tax=Marchantia polymorpha TaxID=3197 RepID=A0AAF6AQW9_MARPO|nr:hypothetical protein MARPO_0001s0006 [Marchantia polymorpha]BBM98839.1 hypothetical protein Mp_1g16640 [Marchantia polymorpha subsp. ruderalis]|eukprot:PTQ49917.1 hypothetical protein MARPO_0001s0006 [Marchantia polymorpha]